MTVDSVPTSETMKKNIGKIVDIIRFPIKGFPGESMPQVSLKPGSGLPGDRRWAIRNGSVEVAENGQWTPCQAFVRLTQETDLPLYRVQNTAKTVTKGTIKNTEQESIDQKTSLKKETITGISLRHPNGDIIPVADHEGHINRLSSWFAYKNIGFSKAQADIGYWDHSDAMISIINLTTVNALSQAAGVELTASRFRGNLLIETDKPWMEFSFVGQRILIGDVELEVLRPIDRCKATSINPKTAELDINIPHLLASQFGHIFCGVYARVVTSGKITTGSFLSIIISAPQAIVDAVKVSTAPAVNNWPRSMRVLLRIEESEEISSFWLEDPLGGFTDGVAPSSYLRLHCQTENGPMSRSYTISDWSSDGRRLRVSIKNQGASARFSSWIHKTLQEGDDLLISGPFVDPSLTWRPEADSSPVLIITAGIGITVATSVLSALREKAHQNSTSRSIMMIHGVRDQNELALWQEVLDSISTYDDAQAKLFMSRAESTQCQQFSAIKGHVDLTGIAQSFDVAAAQVFLCGPVGFSDSMRQSLLQMSVMEDSIHEDIFFSPGTSTPMNRTASQNGPISVRFSDGSKHCDTVWMPKVGTLLDLADNNGLKLPENCRSGACRACLLSVSGAVEYLTEPINPAPKNQAYMCCAAPLEDITVFIQTLS